MNPFRNKQFVSKRLLTFLFFSFLITVAGNAVASPVIGPPPQQSAVPQIGGGQAYWDEDRMKKATPMPTSGATLKPGAGGVPQSGGGERVRVHAEPGFATGRPPLDELQPLPLSASPQSTPKAVGMAAGGDGEELLPPFFDAPTDPDDPMGYAPFQRWTWYGRYLTYPTSTIGKLFFRQDRDGDGTLEDFVCSAVVIQQNTIATAGHCVHNGLGENNEENDESNNNGWSEEILFCPSFNKRNGINPARGCWDGVEIVTTPQWRDDGNWDRDYACIVTELEGGVNNERLGNETGWVGRAWNWPSRQPIHAWGYPAEAPFPEDGFHIITVTSTEWYEVDMDPSEPQASKYIGNDMNAGASGGPWWLNTDHPRDDFKYDDTDGSQITNPGQGEEPTPLLNGLNSHKRENGQVFTQEMGSPQFLSTDDPDESEDVFGECFELGGADLS